MNKHLKLFANHSAYSQAESNLDKPNVVVCQQEGDVHFNPTLPPPIIDGHEYVDLGLPSGTKWATMNVGAASETDYGNYYQYGKGSAQYAATSGDSNYSGTEDPLATSADTAAQVWGGSWHIPTKAQFEELIANTTYSWTSINGVYGGKFTAQNGNYVFFAAAGYWGNGSQFNVGSSGICWGSSPDGSGYAYRLSLRDGGKGVYLGNRLDGCSVRPVVG